MSRLRYLTAGESHGPWVDGIIEGCPAGLGRRAGRRRPRAGRRQGGYGRGDRQRIEQDAVRVLGGVRHGRTTGAPVALFVANRDAANWGDILAAEASAPESALEVAVIVPRPGHADLGGALLYGLDDIRDVIERASARETAAKVACGAVAKGSAPALGLHGGEPRRGHRRGGGREGHEPADVGAVEGDPVRCRDAQAGRRMMAAIDAA